MNILIVDDRIPDPDFGAGFPRAYRFLLSLKELGHKIFFYPTLKNLNVDLNIEELEKFGITVWENVDLYKDKHIDVVIVSRPHNVHYYLPPVRNNFPDAKYIYDTEALWFRRYDLQLEITGRLPGWAYRYDEIGLAKQVDMCFVVNDTEREILLKNGVKKVVKLAHALPLNKNGSSFEDRKNILIVGGKLEEDSTNEDALWWYLENCWSGVWDELMCDMNATGTVLTNRLQNHTFGHISLLGHVKDLVELYQTNKVFVAATRFSTGIPWKVHEAMANGIPCVISRLLANQLELTDDKVAMICDNKEDYIKKTILLYNDKQIWENMRNNAFEYMEIECSIENFKKIIQTNLEETVS